MESASCCQPLQWHYCFSIMAHQHKQSVNRCNCNSFGDHTVLEGDCNPSLKSHGQQSCCSLISSLVMVMQLPISCISYMAMPRHVPAVSMATGHKIWVLASLVCLFCAAFWAAIHHHNITSIEINNNTIQRTCYSVSV